MWLPFWALNIYIRRRHFFSWRVSFFLLCLKESGGFFSIKGRNQLVWSVWLWICVVIAHMMCVYLVATLDFFMFVPCLSGVSTSFINYASRSPKESEESLIQTFHKNNNRNKQQSRCNIVVSIPACQRVTRVRFPQRQKPFYLNFWVPQF